MATVKKLEKKKKTGRALLVFAGVLAVLLALTFVSGYFNVFYAWGSKQKLESVRMEAQLLENGDLCVTETWVMDMRNRGRPYTNGYKSFSGGKFDSIEDLVVYDNDNKTEYTFLEDVVSPEYGGYPSGTCYIVDSGYEFEVGWFFAPIDQGIRTFTFSYTMTGIASVYKDTAELYVGFIGRAFSLPIKNLSITLTLPNQRQNPLVWLHTVANGRIEIVDPQTVTVKATNVNAQTMVECRVLLQPESLPGSTDRYDYERKAFVMDEEQSFFAVDEKAQRFSAFIVVASLGLFVFSFVPLKMFSKAKRHKVEAPEYVRQPPADMSLGAARLLYGFYDGGVDKSVNGDVISALVLSMVQKGWLAIKTGKGKKADTVITPLPDGVTPINVEEKPLWEIFTTLAQKHGGSFTMKEYAAFGQKEYTKMDAAIQRIYSTMQADFNAHHWVESFYFWKRPSTWIGFGLLALALLVQVVAFENFGVLFVCCIISGLIWLVQGLIHRRLTPEGEREHQNLQAFKNYLESFTIIGERAPQEVVLWQTYLIYATLFGCADKVRETMPFPGRNTKEEVRDQSANNFMASRGALYMADKSSYHNASAISGSSFRAFSSIGDTMSKTFQSVSKTASNLARPSGSSGSGGGGSSGGGGGGGSSGGGGGGGSGGGGGVR